MRELYCDVSATCTSNGTYVLPRELSQSLQREREGEMDKWMSEQRSFLGALRFFVAIGAFAADARARRVELLRIWSSVSFGTVRANNTPCHRCSDVGLPPALVRAREFSPDLAADVLTPASSVILAVPLAVT